MVAIGAEAMPEENRQTGKRRIEGDGAQPPKLLDQVREHLRVRHYSLRTEEAYTDWTRRFILFHGKRHPRDMGADEVQAFLSHLAVGRSVSASTQNQAKAALLFLYRHVLNADELTSAFQKTMRDGYEAYAQNAGMTESL